MTVQFSRESRSVPRVSTAHRSIQTDIPAPGTRDILARLEKVQPGYMQSDLPIVWSGATWHSVHDIADNRFIDFTSGIFTANVGHSNPFVADAISLGIEAGQLDAYDYATEIRADYLEALTAWSGFEQALLFSAGTEATEAAMHLMRCRRPGVVLSLEGSFHGRTLGARKLSGMGPAIPGEIVFAMPVDSLKTMTTLSGDISGVMLETFQGWSAKFHDVDQVQAVARWCKENDIPLCFDEMQSGFARTGRKFGYEHYGVTPDLICVGKGMGGGMPLSGVLGRADVLACGTGDMSSTHSGHPLACAAGLAVIEEIERLDLVAETARKGFILARGLREIGPGRATGLIAALDIPAARASRVCERAMQAGLLLVHTGRDSIKIAPPLTIPDDALLEGIQVLAEACSATSA